MNEKRYNAKEILQRYVKGQCTDEERLWVEQWYQENYDSAFETDTELAEEHLATIWHELMEEVGQRKKWPFIKIASVAACIAIVLGISSFYLWKSLTPEIVHVAVQGEQSPINPGRDQALLTLADGRTIHLDSIVIGEQVMAENGVVITKMDDGTLAYQTEENLVLAEEEEFNTVSTPRGGQYKIVLPDNSIVWLNAASSLRFPMAFTGSNRLVELTGEGYFEIAHDENKPFIVSSQNQQTIVKGTKFNITAYPEDEGIVTTLLEGSVLVKATLSPAHADETLLRPNEQSMLHGTSFTKSRVEARRAIAWKEGKFMFNNTPLSTIMQQLSRWYNIDIVYLDQVDGITFTGSVSRSDDIEDVLRKISLTESVRFETKERRVMVRR